MKSERSINQPTRNRWMIVDDDEAIREFMAALLARTRDVEVVQFSSAVEALAAFTAAGGGYQLILTDLEMPGMDGVRFCECVQALAPRVKVLLVTGNEMIDEADVRQLGFCGLVRKPFPAETLRQAVEAAQTEAENNFKTRSRLVRL